MPRDLLQIEPAGEAEVLEIREQLRRAGRMMWEDVDPQRSLFWVCRDCGHRVAWVGLELDGSNALLRSLYTDATWRRLGIGRRLVTHAEREAAARGAASMWLFSTGAGGFFQSLGYAAVPVADAVAALRNTPQVTWYRLRPHLLAAEATYRKAL